MTNTGSSDRDEQSFKFMNPKNQIKNSCLNSSILKNLIFTNSIKASKYSNRR